YNYINPLIASGDGSEYPEFHDILASLYIDFDAKGLLKLLQLSNSITFPDTRSLLESRLQEVNMLMTAPAFPLEQKLKGRVLMELEWKDALAMYDAYAQLLYECNVFLLGRMGMHDVALQVILTNIKKMERAVGYIQKHGDESLWHKLVDKTLTNAQDLIPQLLAALRSHSIKQNQKDFAIDLIQRIPDDLKLAGLKDEMVKLFQEYNIEVFSICTYLFARMYIVLAMLCLYYILQKIQLHQGTANILEKDCVKETKTFVTNFQRGILANIKVRPETCQCTICGFPLSRSPLWNDDDSVWLSTNETGWEKPDPMNRSNDQRFSRGESFFKAREDRKLLEQKQKKYMAFNKTDDNDPANDKNVIVVGGVYSISLQPGQSHDATASSKTSGHGMPQWTNLSKDLPTLRIFFCGHYYHEICYSKYTSNPTKDECIRCCPSQMTKRKIL
ncbi:hypothetical protein RFI_02727, partial [Reticulomyxa filosa]